LEDNFPIQGDNSATQFKRKRLETLSENTNEKISTGVNSDDCYSTFHLRKSPSIFSDLASAFKSTCDETNNLKPFSQSIHLS
jgi:hypothetical protein